LTSPPALPGTIQESAKSIATKKIVLAGNLNADQGSELQSK